MAQTHVVGIGTGVVVGIACEHITLVGVRLHDVGDSTENVAVRAVECVRVNGEVDGSEGCLGSGYYGLYGTLQASLQLSLEVGDAGIGGLQAGTECVAVLSLGANGYEGCVPGRLAEVVVEAEKDLSTVALTAVAEVDEALDAA